jgi:hypothetical protein
MPVRVRHARLKIQAGRKARFLLPVRVRHARLKIQAGRKARFLLPGCKNFRVG